MDRKIQTINIYVGMSVQYIRRSHFEHASCLHPNKKVSIYTNGRATTRNQKNRAKDACCYRSPNAMCSAKMTLVKTDTGANRDINDEKNSR